MDTGAVEKAFYSATEPLFGRNRSPTVSRKTINALDDRINSASLIPNSMMGIQIDDPE